MSLLISCAGLYYMSFDNVTLISFSVLLQPPSRGSSHQEEGEAQMTCPKCGMTCPDLDTLQIHVLDCIDN